MSIKILSINYVMFSTIRCYGKNFSEIGTISGAGNIDFEKGKISLKSYYFEPNNKVYAMEMYVKRFHVWSFYALLLSMIMMAFGKLGDNKMSLRVS